MAICRQLAIRYRFHMEFTISRLSSLLTLPGLKNEYAGFKIDEIEYRQIHREVYIGYRDDKVICQISSTARIVLLRLLFEQNIPYPEHSALYGLTSQSGPISLTALPSLEPRHSRRLVADNVIFEKGGLKSTTHG